VVHGGPARSVCAALCMCAALQLVGEAALAMGAALRDEDAAVPLSGLWPPAEGLRAGVDVGEWLAGGGAAAPTHLHLCHWLAACSAAVLHFVSLLECKSVLLAPLGGGVHLFISTLPGSFVGGSVWQPRGVKMRH
jgi:hypothetical protein